MVCHRHYCIYLHISFAKSKSLEYCEKREALPTFKMYTIMVCQHSPESEQNLSLRRATNEKTEITETN